MENYCTYNFTCFISTCSCVTEYFFPFTESQQCNVTCNAWSFQREPPDPEPEEDSMLSADQTFIIHLITEFQFVPFTLRAISCSQQFFMMFSLCYYCFHDVASMLLLFSWCCLTSSWLFFRPPQREEQRSSSQPNLMGYRFIEGRVYVFTCPEKFVMDKKQVWL